MDSYALRIDLGFSEVQAWLSRHNVGGWAVREQVNGENEHWHFILYSPLTIKQLRCSFNRECPSLKGNGKYSLTLCRDEEKYKRYMAKGDGHGTVPEIVWSHSIDVDIDALHEAYWTANEKLRKRKAASMIDYVIDVAKDEEVKWDNREKLAEIYIREQGKRGKGINLFAVRSSLNAVQLALCPDDTFLNQLKFSCQTF